MERKYRLQECRKAAGYKSAKDFAEHIGMSVRTYTNYEQEVSELTLGLAWKFADALGCSIEDISGREGVRYAYTRLEDDDDDQA